MEFDKDYFINILKSIIEIDSPTGFTNNVIEYISSITKEFGFEQYLTNKGNLVISIDGEENSKTTAISAHIDTLGLMVRAIKNDGTLSFTKIGGPILPTLDGEYCKIYTKCGKILNGTILSNSPSSHVYKDAQSLERNEDNMHIRLDEIDIDNKKLKEIGVQAGDFICYDPKFNTTSNGFIKSRFLDDKMSVAIVISLLKLYSENKIKPKNNLKVIFSTYEEVGHGLAHLPDKISEVLALDMGCIGSDLECDEFSVSICAKDSSGPYDYNFVSELISYAKKYNLNYAVDIYPMYGSDASAARYAGHDIKAALIGPGVHASHGMERSHIDSAKNTFELLKLYLKKGE